MLVSPKPPQMIRQLHRRETVSPAAGSKAEHKDMIRLATIGEMVASVAHESRNFLQRITASAEMLELQLEGLFRLILDFF